MRSVLIVLISMLTGQIAFAQSPSTDIWLMPLKASGGMASQAINITNRPGYDNQPEFSPDGSFIYYTASTPDSATDIFRYHIPTAKNTRLTSTSESEFSPRFNPSGSIMAVVRIDKDSAQRLYQVTEDGKGFRLLSGTIDSVAYFCWLDDSLAAIVVLNSGMELHLLNVATGESKLLRRGVGRSIQRYPGTDDIMFTIPGDPLMVMRYHYPEGTFSQTCAAPGQSADFAFGPDGTLFASDQGKLVIWRKGFRSWQPLEDIGKTIGMFYRLSVSRDGRMISVVTYSGTKP